MELHEKHQISSFFGGPYLKHKYQTIFPSLTPDESFALRANISNIEWIQDKSQFLSNTFSQINITLEMSASIEFAKAYQKLISDTNFKLRIKILPNSQGDNSGITLVENFYECNVDDIRCSVDYGSSGRIYKNIKISSNSHNTIFVLNGKILK